MGLVYTAIVIFTPILVAHAQEVRMYSWAAFFVMGSVIYAHLAISEGRRSDWIKFGAFTAAAMYTHTYALFAAFFVGLFCLVWLLLRDRKKLPLFLVAVGVPVLLFIPWLIVLSQRALQVSQEFWIQEVTGRVIWEVLAIPFSLRFYYDDPLYRVVTVIAFLIIVEGVVVALTKKQPDKLLPLLSVFVFLATFLNGVLLSKLIRPILIPRYMVPLLGVFICALAYGVSRFPRWLAAAVCIVFAISQVGTIQSVYQHRFNGPMDEVAAYLEENAGPDDVFVHFDEHTLHTFAVYVPDHLQAMYLPPDATVYAPVEVHGPKVRIVSDLSELSLENRRVWLAMRIGGANTSQYQRVARELGIEPVPVGYASLDAARGSGRAEFFMVDRSWYIVVLQSVVPGY
jgi:hypothetical protein